MPELVNNLRQFLESGPNQTDPVMTPVQPDILPQLQAVFREVFDNETLQLTEAVDCDSLEAWDSLGHIRLVSAVEEVFNVTFTLDEIEAMTSVPQILALLTPKT